MPSRASASSSGKSRSSRSSALRVLMIASEVHPYSKTGGLADVASALPRALGRLGHRVTVVTPRYHGIAAGVAIGARRIEIGGRPIEARYFEESIGPGARIVFVDCPPLYDRPGLYNERNVDYPDNALRFAFLTAAALDWAAAETEPFSIIHAHDWQAGLAPIYARTRLGRTAAARSAPKPALSTASTQHPAHGTAPSTPHPALSPALSTQHPALSPAPSTQHSTHSAPGTAPSTQHPAPHSALSTQHPALVFTVHNLAYQGLFDKAWVPRLDIGWERFSVQGVEFWDRLSFLKAGVNLSDLVTTVSPTYADEIQRPEYGYGFDGVMRARRESLVGILNGIDTSIWDPATDPYLPAPYHMDDLSGKAEAKRALLETFGLSADETRMARPVIGLVSRMVDQKGFDLLEAAAGRLADLDATFIVVGNGDPRHEQTWRQLAAWHAERIAIFIGFDERRAHLVEGGSDLFLMPSRFEPCGLNQMYSLRYGTVPVVRAVGGLVDTVRPFNPRTGQGTGFLFSDYHPDALVATLNEALEWFRKPRSWRRLQRNGMRKDFSWDRSAAEYVKMYKRVIATRRNTTPGLVS